MRAVIVFAHGSRDPLWRGPVEAVAAAVRQRDPGTAVACAYLELCEPGLPDAAAALVAQGARDVRVLPLFFGMGKHAREDLPLLMAELRQRHPAVRFALLPTAGENPRLTALLADMALEPVAP
ncbi:sirohydrochlorin chelatase [Aquabacterium sp. A08]|uniref:sirohydrochlorin chelatase n=1 Tax=Aquabacterium sp. A08 TaxID=2718532 RepID=UPI00141FD72F|nr:CbiX/SirB N-terminal domain-containing protein [Aquabacterium sp. A08]NIC43388.1 cobalamin biosynthesis protein CbiX [Aquabacterium sp. A08]